MVECVLWDFGDTLADQSWLTKAPAQLSNWPAIYRQLIWEGQLGIDWNLGKVQTGEIASHFAGLLSADREHIADHMRRCCEEVKFFDHAMKAVQSCQLPQAIVTINSDIFSQQVVPNYRLNQLFETIVTSWEEKTLDKSDLCDIALQRLGGVSDRSGALLIDNRIENVESWRARGGIAFHFTGNEAFASEPPDLFKSSL
jgi:phosphoglycolate phosphatase-like HAD superfamily hydrolase